MYTKKGLAVGLSPLTGLDWSVLRFSRKGLAVCLLPLTPERQAHFCGRKKFDQAAPVCALFDPSIRVGRIFSFWRKLHEENSLHEEILLLKKFSSSSSSSSSWWWIFHHEEIFIMMIIFSSWFFFKKEKYAQYCLTVKTFAHVWKITDWVASSGGKFAGKSRRFSGTPVGNFSISRAHAFLPKEKWTSEISEKGQQSEDFWRQALFGHFSDLKNDLFLIIFQKIWPSNDNVVALCRKNDHFWSFLIKMTKQGLYQNQKTQKWPSKVYRLFLGFLDSWILPMEPGFWRQVLFGQKWKNGPKSPFSRIFDFWKNVQKSTFFKKKSARGSGVKIEKWPFLTFVGTYPRISPKIEQNRPQTLKYFFASIFGAKMTKWPFLAIFGKTWTVSAVSQFFHNAAWFYHEKGLILTIFHEKWPIKACRLRSGYWLTSQTSKPIESNLRPSSRFYPKLPKIKSTWGSEIADSLVFSGMKMKFFENFSIFIWKMYQRNDPFQEIENFSISWKRPFLWYIFQM